MGFQTTISSVAEGIRWIISTANVNDLNNISSIDTNLQEWYNIDWGLTSHNLEISFKFQDGLTSISLRLYNVQKLKSTPTDQAKRHNCSFNIWHAGSRITRSRASIFQKSNLKFGI